MFLHKSPHHYNFLYILEFTIYIHYTYIYYRLPIQNHPIHVRYPVQCNYGLWAGEGVVEYWAKVIKSRKYIHVHSPL
jgi:hypothetical protein